MKQQQQQEEEDYPGGDPDVKAAALDSKSYRRHRATAEWLFTRRCKSAAPCTPTFSLTVTAAALVMTRRRGNSNASGTMQARALPPTAQTPAR
jgi:hypothetical protein